MTTQTLTLYIPRQDLINANDRGSWHAKARKTAALRMKAAWFARAELALVTARQHITITYGFTTNHRRDAGNWQPTSKALVDGIVEGGVLIDDSDRYVEGPDNRIGERFGVQGTVKVTITLTPVQP